MEKRGEVSSQQIIMIVLAIAGFIVVVMFLSLFFDQGNMTNRELCKLSIIERATLPLGTQIVPLQCTTEKICISTSGKTDACEQFAGEENIRGVKINLDKPEKAKEIIERETANTIFDCWAMTGEGKLGIFGKESIPELFSGWLGFEEQTEPKCIICSRLAIAEDVKGNETLKNVNVNQYMAKNKVPGSSLTYLQTFTDASVRTLPIVPKVDPSNLTEANRKLGVASETEVDQLAIIFTQMLWEDEAAFKKAFVTGGIVAGASVFIGGVLIATGVGAVVGLPLIAKGVAVGAAVGGVVGFTAGVSTKHTQYQNQIMTAGHCGELKNSFEKGEKGCSFVKTISWDVNVVNNLCGGGIEGNL
ncbi:TPA: hypothetical protein EYQ19_02050 [Candidatus Pacearchaeota archaeon]|nr:hypothetical protein [Candidatus Pacearchaeota archaeon]